jgi:hypothetical protein
LVCNFFKSLVCESFVFIHLGLLVVILFLSL